MRKILIIILAFIALGTIVFFLVDESLPAGRSGAEAETLTDKMLAAVNIQGWDSLPAIKWTFRNNHHFIWDKQRNLVSVKWDDKHVLLDPETQTGKVWHGGKEIAPGNTRQDLLETAWSHFANDSFWLCAPFKVRDPGTQRSVVSTEQGDALLVTYTSGGVTPGDSYLWLLDDTGRPMAWKMWVNILPVGGLKFTWEDWGLYDHQVALASKHEGILTVELTNIQTANSVVELNNGEDPFANMK